MKPTYLCSISRLFVMACLFLSNTLSAQIKSQTQFINFTPGGLLDKVFDGRGNQFSLGEIAISNKVREAYSGYDALAVAASCSSGYFQLYLETGSGMEGTDAASVARLNVLCQVLRDISNLINSPCTASGQKINIWVKKSTPGVAGVATPFYNVPYSTTASGIADNTIWITLNSGIDAFKSVVGPLSTSGGGSTGSTFFHGSIAFNFTGSINWHTDLTTPTPAGKWDLYTTALHEMLHAMGFGTLIDYNGNSVIGAGFKYYTRYDTHLQTSSGSKLLTNSTPACSMYNWSINSALAPITDVLSPGGTTLCPSGYTTGSSVDHTVCANRLEYSGSWPVNIPVYTPYCFEKGSSLSHFEDECYVPAGFVLGAAGPATNNQYFVMSNAGAPGPYSATTSLAPMKRYPTPEERKALCDMGYNVNTTYGSVATLNYINYGGTACPGVGVAGINDGITPTGVFAYTTTASTAININPSSSPFLGNDYAASSFKCLEVVVGAGTFSATSGTSATSVTFTPAAGTHGVQLIRYIPVSSTGSEGNITYIFVYVADAGCVPSPCNLVANGGFENTTPGSVGWGIFGVRCWMHYAESPDLFARGCTTSVYCFPPATWFLNDSVRPFNTSPNNYFIGSTGGYDPSSGYMAEAAQGQLASSLYPGATYKVSFWAKYADAISPAPIKTHAELAVSPAVSTPPFSTVLTGPAPGLTPLCDFVMEHKDAAWHYYTKTITYSGPIANSIVVYHAPWLNPTTGIYASGYGSYLVFDDISIIPASEACTFTLPDTINNCTLLNLDSLVNIPGGTFSWLKDSSAHLTTSHDAMFDPITAYSASLLKGDSGIVTICYHYTTPSGCLQTACDETYIRFPSSTISGPSIVCRSGTATLTNPVPGGTWSSASPLVATVGVTTGIVSGLSAGTAIITYTPSSGCFATKIVTVQPAPITGTLAVCVGGVSGVVDATPGGTWTSSNPLIADMVAGSGVYTGISVGTVTVDYIMPSGCTTTAVIAVGPLPITGYTDLCPGYTAVLSNAAVGGSWVSANTVVATVGSSSGTVTGVSAGTATIDYILSGGCYSSIVVSVAPLPIVGPSTVAAGNTITLTDATPTGSWSSSIPSVATVGATTGIVTGITTGTAVITYRLPNDCYSVMTVTVTSGVGINDVSENVNTLLIKPNPNKGSFTISGYLPDDVDKAQLEITDVLGRTLFKESAAINAGMLHRQIMLPAEIANGIYMLKVRTVAGYHVTRFTLER